MKSSFSEDKNIKIECKTEKISKKFTFLYIADRNRIIWVEEGREMKINKKKIIKLILQVMAFMVWVMTLGFNLISFLT